MFSNLYYIYKTTSDICDMTDSTVEEMFEVCLLKTLVTASFYQ